jgi:hypothetical protein
LHPKKFLIGEGMIDNRATVRSLARAFNRLGPYPREPGPRFCPIESGGGFYVQFAYGDGNRNSVSVIPTGCPRAVAGRNGRWLYLPDYLVHRISAIAPVSESE